MVDRPCQSTNCNFDLESETNCKYELKKFINCKPFCTDRNNGGRIYYGWYRHTVDSCSCFGVVHVVILGLVLSLEVNGVAYS